MTSYEYISIFFHSVLYIMDCFIFSELQIAPDCILRDVFSVDFLGALDEHLDKSPEVISIIIYY